MLAGDADEALDQLERILKRRSLSICYDDIVIPALILAQVDFRRGVLDAKHVAQINDTVHGLIVDLSEHDDVTPPRLIGKEKQGGDREDEDPDEPPAPDLPAARDLRPEWTGQPILCVAGRGPFDGAAAAMLAQLLEKHGLGARLESDAAVSSANIVRLNSADVRMICLSYLELGSSAAHLRHSIRRIRRQTPGTKILAGLWGQRTGAADEPLRASAGADAYAVSLRQAVALCVEAAASGAPDADQHAMPEAGSTAA